MFKIYIYAILYIALQAIKKVRDKKEIRIVKDTIAHIPMPVLKNIRKVIKNSTHAACLVNHRLSDLH